MTSPAHAGISTFKVPGADKHPRGIVAGPDGALWFTDPYAIEIGRLTTEGAFSRYPLARSSTPAFPSKIVAGPDGALWFTEGGANGDNTSDRIGRITTDGDIREFPVPTFKANVEGIASGPDGALWFTEMGASKIGRITTEGTITEFSLVAGLPGRPTAFLSPVDIATGPDGALWFTQSKRIESGIGRITTNGVKRLVLVPGGRTSQGIAVWSDGALWFTQADGWIGRMTPAGVLREFAVRNPRSGLLQIAGGRDGALWFSEYWADRIGRITTRGTISEYPLPPGSRPFGITPGPDGAMWFAQDNGSIGRITARPAPRLSLKVIGRNGCVSSSIRAKVRVIGGERLPRVDVLLGGRRMVRTRRRSFQLRVRARALRRASASLRAVAVDGAGARVTASATLVRCGRPR